MNIGIITLTEGFNYGCKLQNYALLTTIRELFKGSNVITMDNDTCCGNNSFSRLKHNFKLFFLNRKKYFCEKRKMEVFRQFNKKYLNFSSYMLTNLEMEKHKDIDCYICGSDQVWNPNYVPDIRINTAFYAPSGVVRVSYAASIGVESVDDYRISEYCESIGSLDAISVREEKAANYIEQILNCPVEVVLDPTLLLTKDEWHYFEKKPNNCPDNYVLTYFLTSRDVKLKKDIEQYAKEHKLKVINLNDYDSPDWFAVSPNEFVYLIHNCKYFFTDSFHGTAFSIIFQKNFYTFPRYRSGKDQKQESRVLGLLEKVGLQDRFCETTTIQSYDFIDYSGVIDKIDKLKKASIVFLKKSIEKKDKCINLEKKYCMGCGACTVVCPVNAIKMQSIDGFFYPHVSKNVCINCGKCQGVCNVYRRNEKKNIEKTAYCMENKDDSVRLNSSSGGIFYSIAKHIINQNGVIYAPCFDSSFTLKHTRLDKIECLSKAMGSKYIQSIAWESYCNVKQDLIEGKKVLFTGTPCQIKALKSYLNSEYSNLLTQDLICHGVASNKVFYEYIKYLEEQRGARVKAFFFRNKKYGWNSFSTKIDFDDGTQINEVGRENEFFSLFLRNYILRPSCYENCVCRNSDRDSDITLADFWNVKEHDNKGTSLAIANTQKGKEVIKSLIGDMKRFEEVDFSKAISFNTAYSSDIEIPFDKKKFDLEENLDFNRLYRKYIKRSIIGKIYKKIVVSVRKSV